MVEHHQMAFEVLEQELFVYQEKEVFVTFLGKSVIIKLQAPLLVLLFHPMDFVFICQFLRLNFEVVYY